MEIGNYILFKFPIEEEKVDVARIPIYNFD